MILKKNAIITLTCFVLLLGLVYGSFTNGVYAHTKGPCDCTLDSVTIEHGGQLFTSAEDTYYFDNDATEFLVTSYSSMMTLVDNLVNDTPQKAHHIVNSYYSFDNYNWIGIGNIVDFNVPVGDNNNLYFKFTLNSYEVKDTQAAYMHFSRTPGVENIAVDPSTLPASGGNVKATVSGKALPSGLEVRVYDSEGKDLGIISKNTNSGLKSVKTVSETFTVSLPANTTDEDMTYIIRPAINGDWFDISATVTVGARTIVEDDQDDKGSSGGKTGDDGGYIKFILTGLAAVLFIYLALAMRNAYKRRV